MIGVANGTAIKITGDTAVGIASNAAVGIAGRIGRAAGGGARDAYIGTVFVG